MNNCILFDNDGTLVDSERLCNIGLVRKFNELGISLDADELVMRFRGWKLAKILESLEIQYQLKLPEDFVDSYRDIVSELFESELRPVEGIEYALENILQPKAVVSSGPVQKIQQALRVCGLTKYFGESIYSSYEVGIWKPDPGIYLHAARDMGYPVQHCAVVDDGLVGIKAAHKAGIKSYFYNRFDEECIYSSAIAFHSMHALPELINT